ncbi:hypothetical protein MAIT1_01591 [Magnetofaba australis IT-1]|uniref:PEGA domain-containing protein n=1 Tax=Magnetofaba australis IT-1 TaxID=1434232 RepID=A0A1Y2K0W3_9PROT|nr:hypothetical protein MAIT1_01591 [Magnetofaba australis IT-1]
MSGAPVTAQAAPGEILLAKLSADDQRLMDLTFWKSIQESDDPELYDAYLAQFPNGIYAVLAKVKRDKLLAAQQEADDDVDAPPAPPVAQSAPEPATQRYAFTIDVEPADARVRILNIKPRYAPGMRLEPGSYHVEVSRDGYLKRRQWVTLKQADLRVPIALSKAPSKQPKTPSWITRKESRGETHLLIQARNITGGHFVSQDLQLPSRFNSGVIQYRIRLANWNLHEKWMSFASTSFRQDKKNSAYLKYVRASVKDKSGERVMRNLYTAEGRVNGERKIYLTKNSSVDLAKHDLTIDYVIWIPNDGSGNARVFLNGRPFYTFTDLSLRPDQLHYHGSGVNLKTMYVDYYGPGSSKLSMLESELTRALAEKGYSAKLPEPVLLKQGR